MMKSNLSLFKNYFDTSASVDEIPSPTTSFSPRGRRWHAMPDERVVLHTLASELVAPTPHPPFGHLLPQGEKAMEFTS